MTDCPNCEYHRQRAQRWRDEAYKQSGHPLPERGWVGLTDEEIEMVYALTAKDYRKPKMPPVQIMFARTIQEFLKEKNT